MRKVLHSIGKARQGKENLPIHCIASAKNGKIETILDKVPLLLITRFTFDFWSHYPKY